jgi:hypothetical protein
MFDASRPIGRLFYLLPVVLTGIVLASGDSTAQTPARTTISDVVYRAEDRLVLLERNDIKRSVYDRLLNAAITVAISAAITMHDRLGFK